MNQPPPSPTPASLPSGLDLARLEVDHPDPFCCRLLIGEEHLGQAIHHVSNTEYVRWLDQIAVLHADSLGYTSTRLKTDGAMWFVARHEIDYLAETWLGDDLIMLTWVRDMKRVKSWRNYVVYRPVDDTVVCRAATLWVLVDLAKRRPRRIPPDMIEAFRPVSPSGRNFASH